MLKLVCYPLFALFFLLPWLWTRATGAGRYGRAHRRADSFWELPVSRTQSKNRNDL
jgi:hypothetical protein